MHTIHVCRFDRLSLSSFTKTKSESTSCNEIVIKLLRWRVLIVSLFAFYEIKTPDCGSFESREHRQNVLHINFHRMCRECFIVIPINWRCEADVIDNIDKQTENGHDVPFLDEHHVRGLRTHLICANNLFVWKICSSNWFGFKRDSS